MFVRSNSADQALRFYTQRMLGTLLCLSVVMPVSLEPDNGSRAAFSRALGFVKEGWSKAQVRKALGEPDDIWPANDSRMYVRYGHETWCYGTNGHHTLPTLGKVVFDQDKVGRVDGGYGQPPATSRIGDAEITAALRAMYRPPSWRYMLSSSSDSQRLIQSANLLISKGRPKALAILEEYSRVVEEEYPSENWLFWLVRVAFTSNLPGGVFAVPAIGGFSPPAPKDPRSWPTFPIAFVDDVPISLLRCVELAGVPEPFGLYLRQHEKEWTLRARPIVPPNDPFPLLKKLVTSPEWRKLNSGKTKTGEPDPESERRGLSEILELVRSAYQPQDKNAYVHLSELELHHREFLSMGCRWDQGQQRYVRGDGTVLADVFPIYLQHQYRFVGIPGLTVTLTFSRKEGGQIVYDAVVGEFGSQPIRNALLIAEDPTTGYEVFWTPINDPEFPRPGSRQRIATAAPHTPSRGESGYGGGFSLPEGRSLRFAVQLESKRYVSPEFNP